jgi:hypothetical protein
MFGTKDALTPGVKGNVLQSRMARDTKKGSLQEHIQQAIPARLLPRDEHMTAFYLHLKKKSQGPNNRWTLIFTAKFIEAKSQEHIGPQYCVISESAIYTHSLSNP